MKSKHFRIGVWAGIGMIASAIGLNACVSGSKNDADRGVASQRETSVPWDVLSLQDLQLASRIAYTHVKETLDGGEIKAQNINAEEKAAGLIANADELRAEDKLNAKVDTLFKQIQNSPVLNNSISTGSIARKGDDQNPTRNDIRVTSWNIERGQRLPAIKSLTGFMENGVCNAQRIQSEIPWRTNKKGESFLNSKKKFQGHLVGEVAVQETCALNESDILLLNEVDYGTCRSGYSFVADDLARHMGMNFIYAPTFIEIEPFHTGLVKKEDAFCKQFSPERTKNLTGNAILSRFPIKNPRVLQLPTGWVDLEGNPVEKPSGRRKIWDRMKRGVGLRPDRAYCWDWHSDEIMPKTIPDKAFNAGAKLIFGEGVGRELRYGNRGAIIVDLDIGNGRTVTVVNAHLENKAAPECRYAQMNYVLSQVKNNPYPVILGGDFNTTNASGDSYKMSDAMLDQIMGSTFKNPNWYLGLSDVTLPPGVGQASGVVHQFVQKFFTKDDPTRKEKKLGPIGILASPESYLFQLFQREGFIWQSDKEGSLDNKNHKTWSHTNSRDRKGFEASHFFINEKSNTFFANRLDWLLVNPRGNKCVKPRYPRTLNRIREGMAFKDFPSDHTPITFLYGEDPNCAQ